MDYFDYHGDDEYDLMFGSLFGSDDNYFDCFDDVRGGERRVRVRRSLDQYTPAEKAAIEAHCRGSGKLSPWEYVRLQQKKRATGVETKEEYMARKLAEPAKREEKALSAEIPKPKKLDHKQKLNLQQQRMEAGLTQKEAAARINVRVSDIQSWEKGDSTPGPKMSKLKLVYERAKKNKK